MTDSPQPELDISGFSVVRKITQGGMGEVFEALQAEPARRVAIKLVKRGMDSEEVVARFESERHALALMNHPHIAQVYTAGTTITGRPYFVMEYVEGVRERIAATIKRREPLLPLCCAVPAERAATRSRAGTRTRRRCSTAAGWTCSRSRGR